jgi:hypothetical protein
MRLGYFCISAILALLAFGYAMQYLPTVDESFPNTVG